MGVPRMKPVERTRGVKISGVVMHPLLGKGEVTQVLPMRITQKCLGTYFAYHKQKAKSSGYSAVWLARLSGGQEVAGSNPAIPTMD